MSGQTGIQWTDSTWNVVTGCTRVSPGCAHCYIERTPPFRMQGRRFARVDNSETTGIRLHPERLEWRKIPRGPKIFVNSLSDLFHEEVPDEFIRQVFETMRWREDKIFQILTKRPERARDWFGWYEQRCLWNEWPLPNVWMGVSVENARYTWRSDVLRQIPAAVRFISAEPLLGSLFPSASDTHRPPSKLAPAQPWLTEPDRGALRGAGGKAPLDLAGIDWLIAGGESGPKSRPTDLAWIRELRDACRNAGTAFFCKQLGAPWAKQHTKRGYDCGPADSHGGDWHHWPPDLRIREFPSGRAVA